jgi:hypothetical protein
MNHKLLILIKLDIFTEIKSQRYAVFHCILDFYFYCDIVISTLVAGNEVQ